MGKFLYNATMVRTRIAPSPTGEDLHIGNLYTALLNFAFAKKHNGKFIVRIEDTDRLRYVEKSEERILETLKAFGIEYDEGPDRKGPFGPYRQSERITLYQKYAQKLVDKKSAYYCFCTKERLDNLREQQFKQKKIPRYDRYCLQHVSHAEERIRNGEKYVIRLNIPENRKVIFTDVLRGEIAFDSILLDDQVLLKSDGFPTYHLGVVVDDHLMEISHVIRAEEWISSTPKHVLLYEAFGWKLPVFAHVPLLRNADRSKLSKRKNPVWASWYLEKGFLPEAILNYLALMGWSHAEEKELFSLQEFIDLFDLKDIKPVGPIFDIKKLAWINGEYIRQLSDAKLKELLEKRNSKLKTLDQQVLNKLIGLAKTRMHTLSDFDDLTGYFFHERQILPLDEEKKHTIENLLLVLEKLSEWQEDKILKALKSTMEKHHVKMSFFYTVLTGVDRGLPLPEVMTLLGKEKVRQRLKSVLAV